MVNRSETRPTKQGDVIKLDWNDARMVECISNIWSGNKISAEKL